MKTRGASPQSNPGQARGSRQPGLLSVVIPLFDEELGVERLCERLFAVLVDLGCPYEVVLVDDGSADGTCELVRAQRALHPEILIVCLSRNFGLQAAVSAGLEQASGDVVVLMDGDLQDPPELIEEMLGLWRDGADVVYATKRSRKERGLRGFAFNRFHALFARLSEVPVPLSAGNFSLVDRHVLSVINALPERNRYLPGLRSWVGFRQVELPMDREARFAGAPRMGFRRLLKLGMDGIFGFSSLPLKLATMLGFLACSLGLGMVVWVLYERFVLDTAIPGWPSTIIAISFLGGTQLICLGILGEYVSRIYDEVRGRPNFIISELIGGQSGQPDAAVAAPAVATRSRSNPGEGAPGGDCGA